MRPFLQCPMVMSVSWMLLASGCTGDSDPCESFDTAVSSRHETTNMFEASSSAEGTHMLCTESGADLDVYVAGDHFFNDDNDSMVDGCYGTVDFRVHDASDGFIAEQDLEIRAYKLSEDTVVLTGQEETLYDVHEVGGSGAFFALDYYVEPKDGNCPMGGVFVAIRSVKDGKWAAFTNCAREYEPDRVPRLGDKQEHNCPQWPLGGADF